MPKLFKPKRLPFRKMLGAYPTLIGTIIYLHQLIDREIELTIRALVRAEASQIEAMVAMVKDFEARTDLFSQLARMRFSEPEFKAPIKWLHDELDAINGIRNNLIHGRWAGWNDDTLALIRTKPRTETYQWKVVPYTPKQLRDTAKRMWILVNKLAVFHGFVVRETEAVIRRRMAK